MPDSEKSSAPLSLSSPSTSFRRNSPALRRADLAALFVGVAAIGYTIVALLQPTSVPDSAQGATHQGASAATTWHGEMSGARDIANGQQRSSGPSSVPVADQPATSPHGEPNAPKGSAAGRGTPRGKAQASRRAKQPHSGSSSKHGHSGHSGANPPNPHLHPHADGGQPHPAQPVASPPPWLPRA